MDTGSRSGRRRRKGALRPENVIYVAPKERIARLFHKEKERPPKPSARRVVAAICVYLVLSAVWMYAYTVYILPTENDATVLEARSDTEAFDITHSAYGTTVGEPLRVIEFTDCLKAGETATLSILGEPYTLYSPALYLKSGISKNSALAAKYSDGSGYVEWSWRVSHATSPGTYRLALTAYASENTSSSEVCNMLSYTTLYITVEPKGD